jgi:hypothetical protein
VLDVLNLLEALIQTFDSYPKKTERFDNNLLVSKD